MPRKEKVVKEELSGVVAFFEPARKFTLDSYRLVKRCTKPDMKGQSLKDWRGREGWKGVGCAFHSCETRT